MAIRDEVKPNFMQRAWRQVAGYALPGSAAAGVASLVAGVAGVATGIPALAVAGLAGGTASTAVFAGSVALGNRAHEAFRGSVRAMVRGNFQESERQASVADDLGAVNGETYQARSLAWRAAVGGVVLASVGVQAVASAAAAGSVTDLDLGAINSMSAGTKNAVYYQMDHDPAALDTRKLNTLAANFTNTNDFDVHYMDPSSWDVESGLPKLTDANQEWISNMKVNMAGAEYRAEMGTTEGWMASSGNFFHDSHDHTMNMMFASDGHLAGKSREFKNMVWEDKIAILDNTIDKAAAEADSLNADASGLRIGRAMQMLILMTERGQDGLLNLKYPEEGFGRNQVPEDLQDDLVWSARKSGGHKGTNPLDEPFETGAQHTLQQILLNLAVSESNPAVKDFVWDKYRDLQGYTVAGFDMRELPASSMDPNEWVNEALDEAYMLPAFSAEDSRDDRKALRQAMSGLYMEYAKMTSESKLAIVDKLLLEGRNEVANAIDADVGDNHLGVATTILVSMGYAHVSDYNPTPEDIRNYQIGLRMGDIQSPPDKSPQHEEFSEAVHYMALTEKDPIVRNFLWDQVRDISGMNEHLQQQGYREGSLERGTISNEVVGAEVEHVRSSYEMNLETASEQYHDLPATSKIAVATALIDQAKKESNEGGWIFTPAVQKVLDIVKDADTYSVNQENFQRSVRNLDDIVDGFPRHRGYQLPIHNLMDKGADVEGRDESSFLELFSDYRFTDAVRAYPDPPSKASDALDFGDVRMIHTREWQMFGAVQFLTFAEKDPVVKEFLWNQMDDLRDHIYEVHLQDREHRALRIKYEDSLPAGEKPDWGAFYESDEWKQLVDKFSDKQTLNEVHESSSEQASYYHPGWVNSRPSTDLEGEVYLESSLEQGTISNEVVGSEIEHVHSSYETKNLGFLASAQDQWIGESYRQLYEGEGKPLSPAEKNWIRENLVNASKDYANLSVASKMAVATALFDQAEIETDDPKYKDLAITPAVEDILVVSGDSRNWTYPEQDAMRKAIGVTTAISQNLFEDRRDQTLYAAAQMFLLAEDDPTVKGFLKAELGGLRENLETRNEQFVPDVASSAKQESQEGRKIFGDKVQATLASVEEAKKDISANQNVSYQDLSAISKIARIDQLLATSRLEIASGKFPDDQATPSTFKVFDLVKAYGVDNLEIPESGSPNGKILEESMAFHKEEAAEFTKQESALYLSAQALALAEPDPAVKAFIFHEIQDMRYMGGEHWGRDATEREVKNLEAEGSKFAQEPDSLRDLREQGASASEYLRASYKIHEQRATPLAGKLSEAVARSRACVSRENRNQSDSIWNTDIRYRTDRGGDPFAGMTWRQKQSARQAMANAGPQTTFDFRSNKGGQKLCADDYVPINKAGEFVEQILSLGSSLDSTDSSQGIAFLVTPKPETKAEPAKSTLQSEFDRLSASRDKGQASESFHQNGGTGLQAVVTEPVQKAAVAMKAPVQKSKGNSGRA